jgi:peptide/nickel transport system substrate-binding protein
MRLSASGFWAITAFLAAISLAATASGQKRGGVPRMYSLDSPANMSMLEAVVPETQRPMMGVFNNLILFDQHVPRVSLQSIVPDLATNWSWSEDGTELTFTLRQGVKWHDGRPSTAQDVKCTWDLQMDKGRRNSVSIRANLPTATSQR